MSYKSILLIFILVTSTITVFGQEETVCEIKEGKVCVMSSKGFYEEGQTVVISGKVSAVILDAPVSLQIFFSETLIQIDQVKVAQDGTFTTTLIAGGPQWSNDGIYTIRVAYSGSLSEANFEYKSKEATVTTNEIIEVDAGTSGTFDVEYVINGGTLKNILIDPDIFGVIVIIEANNDGVLTLDLPRASIDAKKSDGTDEDFIIFADGAEIPYQETKNAESRILTLQFEEGDSNIEIIGTFVVPEFGDYAMMILLFSITTIIIISSKKNLKINSIRNF